MIDIGAFQEAHSVLQKIEPGSVMEILYSCLCRIGICDQSAEGLEWATRYLRGIAAFFLQYPTDGGHMRKLLFSLGMAERIFRDAGRQEDFHRRLDELREKLGAAGYRTEGTWFLTDPVDLPAVPPAASLKSWNSTTGDDQTEVICEKDAILFQIDPHRPVTTMRTPRITQQVAGDFTLQATIHSGVAVLESDLELHQLQSTGQKYPLVKGGGGLLIIRDQNNRLEFFAHAKAPGEVLLQAHCQGNRQHLGRGLLEDTPIRLRLERKGTTFCAYAGNPEDHWYCCGKIDLPGWERIEVGLYGETTENLTQASVEKGETRFWNIGLQAVAYQPAFVEEEDDLFPLPAPVYAPDLSGFVAASDKIRKILEQTRKVGDSFLPILIQGETGTGKELIARALHQLGNRASGPFMPVNCAAIAPELLDSELFGHVRGAYTGANESQGGLFEAADKGTLFLDEIGEATPKFQAHLLRVIEEQAVRRVGDQRLRSIDVRIVAATNRDVQQAIAKGSFRQDLYFRLQGKEIYLPPLRERRDDIPNLVAHTLERWSRRRNNPRPAITCKAMAILMDYAWPGNVRELFHVVERAAGETEGEAITPAHLSIQSPQPVIPSPSDQGERPRIIAALRATEGNISAAARRLDISRNTLYRRMRRLNIKSR